MGRGAWWAYGIAAIAVLMFVVGTYAMFDPPAPSCGPQPSVYCEEAAYARLQRTVLVGWGLAIALMVCALGLLAYTRREALVQRVVAPPRQPVHARDGRRLAVARVYEDLERRRRFGG